ncbi:BZ3500_MvSof-1268-A1-R1_Chr6-2g08608 [Microbotryum saponariae]|uniref:BZ3500_MvSof-1268-A1-R1_Chr6-2g08608 protein n=1 Tax=Microbotryum saponariae TaxID=289078 RepID=A0A2X0LQQ8_9BASI|nr:BZ3500_MvSof-1268-A1-R1_Chr6-2g08608 [Microbotryum saponariae]SDA07880.1 BZ3501_MvSof-1269-A2-R1_Chr6-1g08317 [Microbotryum saponariae]
MPKASTSRSSSAAKHDPLSVQMTQQSLVDSGNLSLPGKRQKNKHKNAQSEQEHAQTTLDAKVSRRVLEMARDQQDELAQEQWADELDQDLDQTAARYEHDDDGDRDDDDDDDDDDDEKEDDNEEEYEEYEELEFDANDAALDQFMPQGRLAGGRTLADLIMEKIEQQENDKTAVPVAAAEPPPGYNPKIVEVYTKVGGLLSRYKSGPLPKAFKILPTLRLWPQLVMLTVPENWTPHATLAATKIFASNLDPKQSQKFYKEILLEKVREEIQETHKLSVHTYMALKKAIYKPAAFFKGILFPLCESQTCTLREAAILGSVLTRVSVPVLHSGAALLKLADMEYTGKSSEYTRCPNSVFIRVLLDKKYALPYKVVDALVFHFIRFKRDPREMPVLWHQSFLVFVQRYKSDLTEEQKRALLDTLKVKVHPQITPEIRREILNSVARGKEVPLANGQGLETGMAMEVEIC